MNKKMKFVAVVATLLIAAAGVITFEACNKKNEVVNNIPELNVAELSDMDKEMILFGEKMKSATKGGETMQLDEAVRNLSNYENFKMCDASRYSADMERLTIESEIPVTNGNVYLSDINAIYESNRKQIKDKLASLEGDDKTVYCVYSRIDENSKDGEDVRVVTDAYIFRSQPIGFGIDINDTDYWYSCCLEGKCGPYYGQNIGEDAVTRLEDVAKSQILIPSCVAGYRVYLIDKEVEYVYSNEWIDPNSPNGHYGLIDYDYEITCLDPTDMAYYRNNIISKLTEWSTQQATSHRVLTNVLYLEFVSYSILWAEYDRVECTWVGLER